MDENQADAIVQGMSDLGRDRLVAKDYLDARLAQLVLTNAATTFELLGLFKIFA